MRILFEIGHPAHVHQFKNTIWELEKKGHDVKICATNKDVTISLLNSYRFDYDLLGINQGGLLNKSFLLVNCEYRMLNAARQFKPDIFISRGSPISSFISKFFRKPHITFSDSESAKWSLWITLPFSDAVITPAGFSRDLGVKQIRINGYKEHSYLHPRWFKPNPDVLDILNVSKDERYIILRFSAFNASHDIGVNGLTLNDKRRFVNGLSEYAPVFISSEARLPDDLLKYKLDIPPYKMHDALFYSALLAGDTQTSTTEAASLGTPAVRCNSFVGPNDMSNFIELEKKYKLIFNFSHPDDAFKKCMELIQINDLKAKWESRRNDLFRDKIDVTAFMTWLIEAYPDSLRIMSANPSYQEIFK